MNYKKFSLQQIFSYAVIFILLFCLSTFAQVNTERMRKIDKAYGFDNSLQIDFSLYSGNTEFYQLKTNYRADYITPNHYSFGIIQYQRGFQGENLFLNL